MAYFLIRCNDDGEVSVRQINPQALARSIAEGDYDLSEFKSALPTDAVYAEEWGPERMVLIKGEIVVPQGVEVVTRVTIP